MNLVRIPIVLVILMTSQYLDCTTSNFVLGTFQLKIFKSILSEAGILCRYLNAHNF